MLCMLGDFCLEKKVGKLMIDSHEVILINTTEIPLKASVAKQLLELTIIGI